MIGKVKTGAGRGLAWEPVTVEALEAFWASTPCCADEIPVSAAFPIACTTVVLQK